MDWNDDGLDDIIVGDRQGGVHYFRRLLPDTVFLIQEDSIHVDQKPLDVGHNSSPTVFDWNNDGLQDLIVGRTEGIPACLYLFLNTGSSGNPLFSATDTVRCAGEPIQIYYSYPDFHDLNFDGLEDLIVGASNGNIHCFENTGTPSMPSFEELVLLRSNGEDINVGDYVRPTICDWNEDGIPDLLIGTGNGTVSFYPGLPGQSVEKTDDDKEGFFMSLGQNPATGTVPVTVHQNVTDEITISVYSINGRLVNTVLQGVLPAGSHEFSIDLSGLSSGLYLISCSNGSGVRSTKLVTLL